MSSTMEASGDSEENDLNAVGNYFERAAMEIRDMLVAGGIDRVREVFPDVQYHKLNVDDTKGFMQETVYEMPDTDYYFNGSANISYVKTHYEPTILQSEMNKCFNGDVASSLQVASLFAHQESTLTPEKDKALRFGANTCLNQALSGLSCPPRGFLIAEPRIEDLRRLRKSFEILGWGNYWERTHLYLMIPESELLESSDKWIRYTTDRVNKDSVTIFKCGDLPEEKVACFLNYSEDLCMISGKVPTNIGYSNFRIGDYIDFSLRTPGLFEALRNTFSKTWQLHHGPLFLAGKESRTYDIQSPFKIRTKVGRHLVQGTPIGDYEPELALTELGKCRFVDTIVPPAALGSFDCHILNCWDLFQEVSHGSSVDVYLSDVQRYLECLGFMSSLPVRHTRDVGIVKPFPLCPSDLAVVAWNQMILQPKLDGFPLLLEGDGHAVWLKHPTAGVRVQVGKCRDQFKFQCEYLVPAKNTFVDISTFMWETTSFLYGYHPEEFLNNLNYSKLYLVHCLEYEGVVPIGIQEVNFRDAFIRACNGDSHPYDPFAHFELANVGNKVISSKYLYALFHNEVRKLVEPMTSRIVNDQLFDERHFQAMFCGVGANFSHIKNNKPFFIPAPGVSNYISTCEEGLVLIHPLETITRARSVLAVKRTPTDDVVGAIRKIRDIDVGTFLGVIGRTLYPTSLLGFGKMMALLPMKLSLSEHEDGTYGGDVMLRLNVGTQHPSSDRDLFCILLRTHVEVDAKTRKPIRTRYDKIKGCDSVWPKDACTMERVYATLLQPYRSQVVVVDKSITASMILDLIVKMKAYDTFDEDMAISPLGQLLLRNSFLKFEFSHVDPRYALLAEMHMIYRNLFLNGNIPYKFICRAGIGGKIRFLCTYPAPFFADVDKCDIPTKFGMCRGTYLGPDSEMWLAPPHYGAPNVQGIIYCSNNYPKSHAGDEELDRSVCGGGCKRSALDVRWLATGHALNMGEFYAEHAAQEIPHFKCERGMLNEFILPDGEEPAADGLERLRSVFGRELSPAHMLQVMNIIARQNYVANFGDEDEAPEVE